MLWLFRKIFDPNAARDEAEAQRRQREDWPPGLNPDDADVTVPPKEHVPVAVRCRVCGHEAVDEKFCPGCLAETMEPKKR
jgi:hypothetical protein